MLNRICMFLAGTVFLLPGALQADDDSALLLKSRALTSEYATLLQGKLKEAMATGGPVAAIRVCKEEAPGIAAELSRRSGAEVGRTSLRHRNPENAPDAAQQETLESFDSGSSTEFLKVSDSGDALYMKAIPTGAVCLVCHGVTIAPEISEVLDAEYPDDRARGYQVGDVRGAFSIRWPADASE